MVEAGCLVANGITPGSLEGLAPNVGGNEVPRARGARSEYH